MPTGVGGTGRPGRHRDRVQAERLGVVVGLLGARPQVDPVREDRDERRLGLPHVQLDSEPSGQSAEAVVEGRNRFREVEVGSAELAVVQRAHQGRTGLVDQPHQCPCLGEHVVEGRPLVVEREGPLHLLVAGRSVEVPRIVRQGERSTQPARVEGQSVRIDAGHQVPAVCGAETQRSSLPQPGGQVERGETTDRLVGVRETEDDRVPGPVTDGQAVDRTPFATVADRADRAVPLGRDGVQATGQLLRPEEDLVDRYATELLLEPAVGQLRSRAAGPDGGRHRGRRCGSGTTHTDPLSSLMLGPPLSHPSAPEDAGCVAPQGVERHAWNSSLASD